MSQTLELLQKQFPNRLIVRPVEAGQVIGLANKTTYNQISAGLFPLPLVRMSSAKGVRLLDIADYIDNLRIINRQ